MAQQKVKYDIPFGLTYEERVRLGYNMIAYIQKRSQEGKGKDGESFSGYSASYIKTSGKSSVDLTDTGDMLATLILLTHRSGSLTIGYESSDPINGKVEGNRLGTYGQNNPISGKARDFLALSQSELDELFGEFLVDEDDRDNDEILSRFADGMSDDDIDSL